jgi:hypothetical protein
MAEIITLPSQRAKATDDEGIFNTWWYNFFQDIWRGMRRNIGVKLGGTVYIDTDEKENSGSSETDLMEYEIPANLFANDGDYLELYASGTFASNANNKTLKIIFGTQTILQTDANAANGGTWQIKCIIARKSSDTQSITCEILSNNSSLQNDSIYPVSFIEGVEDFEQNIILRTVGLGSASADIIQKIFIIKFYSNS